ncbi:MULTISPECIES: siroheme synthase CysG [unclassified Erwinia]|uniref:siroheme synthase CysG n=1 Tax=unclassified Erwinia TaxID=2622719 RepID=UPI000700F170|nr:MULTISPECIES: siroheme synthase CysG [unclassified Erwinia]KQN64828.1 sirohydrochlorin ferrochelatase [Erwinia sp. Leaf53]PLV63036.1 sirohydrochlorin ferrochelatase [Erwinia sp. B116]
MEYLPLFAQIRDKPVLVVGGGDVAARKIELLRRAGARVQVVSRELCEELAELHADQQIAWLATDYQASQLDRVFLVIAATDDGELNGQVFQDATDRYLLANVVDDQPKCSFIFPSIVDRSPLVVAISSSGTAPVLARLLREKIETLLPANLGQMAEIAGQWREKVKDRFSKMSDRRRFWEKAFNGLFASQVGSGNISGAKATLDQQLSEPEARQGEIILVGAGPGDSGLLTLRGLQVMQLADVVLYDHLVSPEVLDLVRRDADRICVGKRASEHVLSQEQTNALLVKLALEGKRVVRLKGGDPFIFGRGGEELQAAKAAGIPFQVVPGVTAAAGATAYAGIPLTHRDYAQSVLFITGQCRADGAGTDWPSLARARQTLAIYMGSAKAGDISRELIAHGRDPQTPVAVIGRGTRQDQQVLTGTLEQLETLAAEAPTPSLLVIGEVVKLHQQLAWYQHSAQQAGRESAVVNLA